ncbi:hypothetical protein A3C32_00640 [Candidatus Daviesbacteria bacterium RIFCSPHIGHO2_02_FULL_41_14]|uniref:Uncharacterized protein n=1 Tax=Candidatus Daviesbacteria bacterium RIFCSPLOWO2_01_FULL_40_24 TaxID=1797787 RepID=A0A1F5MKF4_9BACT|nr:MAG: hypothetical protein A2780_00510 [Candidatus Daviesbacteria bacterium RIFCSPHIGHO2_01_FULL_41_45]OGE34031.1 MAG: hypothetical protein A3C32_00640 [Candidatus Daviesbacteria bacterium RIFCSPHIGHO2_02_FULL_41_14]OGE65835.1 MAG: hypothetical protein A3B49_03485 [Candidatus Daviesbacteria bacterium RIFCSPLOWO2_01_FULL_40_24]
MTEMGEWDSARRGNVLYAEGVVHLEDGLIERARVSFVEAYKVIKTSPVNDSFLGDVYRKLAIVEELDGHPLTADILNRQANKLLCAH